MCLYPQIIKNKKYQANKKNGGVIPQITDKRMLYVPIGCGKCIECMKKKAREWQVRLQEDIKKNNNAIFITLTFKPEELNKLINGYTNDKGIFIEGIPPYLDGYEKDNAIAKLAVKRFRERWRWDTSKSIRHWLITEIGGKNHEGLHLHGLIWTNEKLRYIEQKWQYGNIYIGKWVNEITINYITKYVHKIDLLHKEYKPIILTSPAIGQNYIGTLNNKLNKFIPEQTKEEYITRQGRKLSLPMYYRNHTYTEDERNKLWIEKLNKNERYILGRKIDMNKGEESYYKLLELAREKNQRLGYGNNQKDWSLKRYENQRRNLKIQEKATIKKREIKNPIETKSNNTIEEIIATTYENLKNIF